MSNIIKLTQPEIKAREAIQVEASSWLVRVDSEDMRDVELDEFLEWLNRSPLHQDAFRRAVTAWHELDQLSNMLGTSTNQSGSQENMRVRGKFSLLPGLRHAVAALLVVAGLTAGLFAYLDNEAVTDNRSYTASYTTMIGETRSIHLP